MSAEGQGDLPSLDKEAEASATTIQPGIPKNSSETKAGISCLSKSDTQKSQNTLTFMGEELEPFDDDVEAVIEKKLSPLERDKGLDVDSELDFELKWDDDSDNANDNQSAAKIDAKIDEKLEIYGDKGDDPSTTTTNTLVGKVADETPNMEQKTSEQENIDKPEFRDQLDYLIGGVSEASTKESENQVALEESKVIHTAPNVEKDVFTMETNAKIGLEGKISSEASENSSLDERLVYSDVEVPEIEDKELMDELDAQICGSDPNEEEKDIEDETVSVKASFVAEIDTKDSKDAGSSQQITASAMDVDEVAKLDPPNDKLDPSDTLSSSTDLETSSYEINKEHKLAKPDVMLEIPTQELIESFDDSDMSDVALEYDEDVLLNNDATNDIVLIEDQKLPANKETVDNIANSNANNKDERETHAGITEQPDILQMESIAIETETSKILDKLVLESDSENENSKTTEIKESEANEIELMDIDDEKEESHADIILEAHLEPNVIETEVASHIADEPTAIVEMDIIMPVTLAPEADTDTIEISSSGEIEPIMSIENTDIKKVISVVGMETNVDKVTNAVEMGPEVLVDVKETDTATDLEPKMVTEAIEIISTSDVVAKETTLAKEGISTLDVAEKMVQKTVEAVSTSQVVPTEATAKDVISTADVAEKLIPETLEVAPTGTNDTIDAISTANVARNEILDTMEVISMSEVVPEEVTATKEVISTIDAPTKVDAEDKIESSAGAILEEETDAKEVVSVADDPVKEVSESKSDIPAKTNLEEVTVAKEVTLTADEPAKVVSEAKSSAETVPEVSKEVNVASSHTKEVKEASPLDQAQPSSSKYMQDSSDEDQELTDSLGLLAESVRVMDDDDEPELEDDEDDDFDQDDESNQMTAEHSEDSNAQHSETEVAKEAMEAEEAMEVEEAADDKGIPFQIAEVISASDIEVVAETEVPEIIVEGMEVAEDTEVEKAVQSLLEVEEGKIIEEAVTTVAEVVEPVTDDAVKSNDPVEDNEAEEESSKLRQLLIKSKDGAKTVEGEKTSPSKTKKLEIAKPKNEINIVELEESSSEDDIQELPKLSTPPPDAAPDVTTVNIPDGVEVMSAAAGHASAMRRGAGELVISGVPRPPPNKPARLNTGEVTIKTAATTTEPLVIPEAKTATAKTPQDTKQPKLGLEIFSLDSDDDEKESAAPKQLTAVEIDKARATGRCINAQCRGGPGADTSPAGAAAVAYYGGRRGAVCRPCAVAVTSRGRSLIEGIKALEPLLSLDMGQTREELVEISDSDSEEEASAAKTTEEAIGEKEADFLEDQLASMFNKTWKKYNMDERLKAAESEINIEVLKLEEECSKINAMLNECQVATDKLRNDLYDTFSGETNELPAILIYDTPPSTWSGLEENIQAFEAKETRQSKRRSSIPEPPAKRAAIPLGYTPLDSDANTAQNEPKAAASSTDVVMQNDDDNSDVSVVKLSAEAAPADLPGPGTASRPPLVPQMTVYAMRNAFGSWSRARIMDVQPKVKGQFTMCRVKFEHKVKNPTKVLQARCLAYEHPSDVRMTIGTRLIALFKDNDNKRESHYSGIVAEIPNPVNNYRYLVFFDDGYAQYVQHSATRLVCESAPLVWDEVHPFSRQFVREYLRSYPERPMVRVHAGQSVRTEYNGKWWDSKVLQVDASLVQVHFDKENRTEWIYRGSTRLAPLYWELQAAERQRARPLPRAQPGKRFNMPYVEYTRSDDPAPPTAPSPAQIEQDIRRQRAVAKKSTAAPPPPPPAPLDGVASRVVFYTPKNAIRPHKMTPHTCGPRCRRTDVLALKDLRTYNPLTKPLLSGWERQIVKFKWSRSVMYRAPCGRRLRNYQELHRYLQTTCSDMPVDLFDFGPNTHCLAEFVLTKCRISKKDLSHGKENVPVPCVNYYDDSLPEFCSYNTERTPTAGVPLNLDPEFLCGCDCTDDCADKSKCACWKMTLEGARTIGLDTDEVGYVYKRLPEPLPSGIYECNARCKCRQTCLNRVAQHPLQLKLQVFKTLNRGWGIRALNDIPKGAFLCVYAGNLLTDATANLDGLNEGDEYLAELDYIEVVEQMKEGFESDIPDADKKLDKESGDQDDSSTTASSSDEEEDPRKNADDDDFRPALPLAHAPTEFSKRLRKREKKKKDEKEDKQKEKDPNAEDNCITISDDEELREPARFAAQAGMGEKGFISKHKSVRAHFGKDEACYIMDAKVQGNIGRYLNHSCTPNVFVQNVFVDTHDPRFPWVAFFALSHIRAGTELTWNYNYDVGSVPGKVLYCHCAAPNCRGRLL